MQIALIIAAVAIVLLLAEVIASNVALKESNRRANLWMDEAEKQTRLIQDLHRRDAVVRGKSTNHTATASHD